MTDFVISEHKGNDIFSFLSDLAKLRISVFREYPYLYDGTDEAEEKYLKRYLECDDFRLFLLIYKNKVIGASTSLPLKFEDTLFSNSFKSTEFNVEEIFYFGESIILPEYRGNGIYKEFFNKREEAAKSQGYKYAAFASVNRSKDDPRRPVDYKDLTFIWNKYGYYKDVRLTTQLSWQEIGESCESEKSMTFWLKKL